jgi:type I restriction enzyme S subunit
MRPVPANSVLICCIGTIGKAGFSKVVATTNQQITAASFEQEARYYFYAILSASEVLDEVATGNVLKILNSERLGSLYFPIPPLPEQKQIARFLDYETGKIDLLIEKQQALIALLKEKRQAVISHAVTKGLNPHARMKDSGVEWLGEVPEGWAVAKLSYRYEVLLGKMLDDKKITGNYLGAYLRNTDVQWDEINDQDLPSMDFRPDEQSRFSVKKGDLLVCEGGEIGRCAIWEKDEPCYYQKALHRLRPLKIQTDSTRYMFYLLYNAVHEERFISGAGKSTIAHLPAETFKQYRFAFPPKDEQEEIFSYLDTMNDKFNATESSALKGIDLLQERRTALISAAVTGKIDVRDWELEAQSV